MSKDNMNVSDEQQRFAEQRGLESLTQKAFEFFRDSGASVAMSRTVCRVYLKMPELEKQPDVVGALRVELGKIWEEERR